MSTTLERKTRSLSTLEVVAVATSDDDDHEVEMDEEVSEDWHKVDLRSQLTRWRRLSGTPNSLDSGQEDDEDEEEDEEVDNFVEDVPGGGGGSARSLRDKLTASPWKTPGRHPMSSWAGGGTRTVSETSIVQHGTNFFYSPNAFSLNRLVDQLGEHNVITVSVLCCPPSLMRLDFHFGPPSCWWW